jgi:hypothetical protein
VVVISDDSTLSVGDTALLVCVTYSQQDEAVSWMLNGRSVMNSSLVTIYEEDVTEGELVFRQSFLQLCSLTTSDAGAYYCVVSADQASANATIRLTVAS